MTQNDSHQNETELQWYAAYTKYQKECQFRDMLDTKKICHYLPLDMNSKPLFPCYVFVQLPESQLHQVRYLRGFVRWVGFGNGPAIIPGKQIETMKTIADISEDFYSQSTRLLRGDSVRLIKGPLRGMTGMLVRDQSNTKLAMEISHLNQAIILSVPLDWVMPEKTLDVPHLSAVPKASEIKIVSDEKAL